MRDELLDILACPVCSDPLTAAAVRREGDHVMEGHLACRGCGAVFPVVKGVPTLLPPATTADDDLEELKARTVERFGFEWLHYKDWGWHETPPPVPGGERLFFGGLMADTARAFWSKSQFLPEDFGPGLLVLDGGCGNGRFTCQAARTGATVVGIDLGWGVHSAFNHMRHLPNVHIVRGDLFNLPFPATRFDRVFSIGVLMHTGDAGRAFDSLARRVKPGGLMVGHVYGRGLPAYEAIDSAVRAVTTRLPLRGQMGFAKATAALARALEKRPRLHASVFPRINLLPTDHHMFDWWAAPIATHHTLDEVRGWFQRNGIEVLRANVALDGGDEAARRWHHSPITMCGRRSPTGG